MTIRLEFDNADDELVAELVEQESGLAFETRLGNDPLTALVVVGTVALGARLVVRVVNEVRGGVVIDLTRDPILIERHAQLPYGFFLVRAADGSTTIEAKDEPVDGLERLVNGLLQLSADAGTAQIVEAATTAVGSSSINPSDTTSA